MESQKRSIVRARERQVVQEALFGNPPEQIVQRVQLSPQRVGKILRLLGYQGNLPLDVSSAGGVNPLWPPLPVRAQPTSALTPLTCNDSHRQSQEVQDG